MLKGIGAGLVLAAAVILGLSEGGVSVQAGGGCHEIASGFTDAESKTVSIEQCKFVPAVVRVEAGDAIQWQNNDDVAHMVAGVAGSWGDSKQYTGGEPVSYTFTETGVYPYFCEMHPGMVGAVIVGDAAAASADPGKGVLAVSAVGAAAGGAQPAASAQDDQGDEEFGLATIAVIGVATATISAAIALLGLRLTRRLPRS